MKSQYIIFFSIIVILSSCASVQGRTNDAIEIGMNKDEVRVILGEPYKIYNSENCPNCKANEETWFYKGLFFQMMGSNKTVIFNNGKVRKFIEGHWFDK